MPRRGGWHAEAGNNQSCRRYDSLLQPLIQAFRVPVDAISEQGTISPAHRVGAERLHCGIVFDDYDLAWEQVSHTPLQQVDHFHVILWKAVSDENHRARFAQRLFRFVPHLG